ncbi:hypothetical protein [Pseudomonas salomonii]|uniref:Uncharacterized protein n=1 Tax=Pseudomonas salomonii TaxID=191391 RepID=A0A1H3SJT0_9PSED|nr:hypothetical protein [Pseudomonas salomonii]SDZ37948.1 hypothetical protein SAMN05216247_109232 [Pseudomonas salomonii]
MANVIARVGSAGLLWALLITFGVSITSLYSRESAAAPLMMHCRECEKGDDTFDATKWFSSGMYRLETDIVPNPMRSMTRTHPVVFKAKDNDQLVEAALRGISDVLPSFDSRTFEAQWPVLTRRLRYSYSFFMAPDEPRDLYDMYLQVGKYKLVIVVGLDVNTGEITAEYEGRVIRENDGNDPAYMDTFEEMDNANTR